VHLAKTVDEVDWRRLLRDVVEEFREQDLLVAASGIAFRVLLCTVVGALFLVGLLGFLGLAEVWRSDLAPDVRNSVSDPAFRVINDAALHVLNNKAVFWVTGGLLIVLWQVSRMVRACGQTLNRIYGVREERPLLRQFWESIAAAAAVAVIMLAALAVVRLGPLLLDDVLGDSAIAAVIGFLVRWAIAAALMTLAVGVVVRSSPSIDRPLGWVSFGSALTVGGWIVSSLLFGLYLSVFATFGSVYGALLAMFLLVEYLYVAAVVFLGGLVVDHLVREEADD
jgi:membrane protein